MAGSDEERQPSEAKNAPRRRRFTAKQAAKRIAAIHAESDAEGRHGCSFSLLSGNLDGADLYVVSPYRSQEMRVLGVAVTVKQVEAYIRQNLDLLRLPDH